MIEHEPKKRKILFILISFLDIRAFYVLNFEILDLNQDLAMISCPLFAESISKIFSYICYV